MREPGPVVVADVLVLAEQMHRAVAKFPASATPDEVVSCDVCHAADLAACMTFKSVDLCLPCFDRRARAVRATLLARATAPAAAIATAPANAPAAAVAAPTAVVVPVKSSAATDAGRDMLVDCICAAALTASVFVEKATSEEAGAGRGVVVDGICAAALSARPGAEPGK
jgi:hypothetical protein